ncbi:superoxide dismutase [Hamiltosporidium magnivora]|uniref:Superoxide dismutase n=1 Tax=Hamiltosporidium magnivora TaxID=148818 RepID=A0A4Q9LJ72_9MICR|nr:superoxide dismutase [Hamiltosporidium magnivora]
MVFSLPSLLYQYNELEPYIDTETMKIHHQKHHQTYINNLNSALSNVPSMVDASLVEILLSTNNFTEISADLKKTILNNAGGHYNHSLFWVCMSPNSNVTDMLIPLKTQIEKDFQSFENMKNIFNSKALSVFGSGWVWLCYNTNQQKLSITTSLNQDNPISFDTNLIPFLCLDVWEHAYYLKYQNKRKDYVDQWWNTVDWKNVSLFYDEYALTGHHIRVEADGKIGMRDL